MAPNGPTAGRRTVTGYILPAAPSNKDEASESEDEEEEEIQPEFLDMAEMDSVSSGGNMFQASLPAANEVSFMAGNETYLIVGRFPLLGPWWEVTCTIRQGWHKSFMIGFPSYRLRTDLRSEGRSLVSLFLTACMRNEQPEFVQMFMEWLPIDRHVEFVHVLDVLQDFEDSSPENKAVAQEIKSRVIHSAAWTQVKVASLYPEIMKYLPTLLPGQFLQIINKGSLENKPETSDDDPTAQERNDTSVLAKLEELIKNDVWKLGFNYIMFKELHLIRCEANLEAFDQCNLLGRIPELQRDALLLYEILKKHCSSTGSTYGEREMLDQKLRDRRCDGAWNVLPFLLDEGVLMNTGSKYALRNLFIYEEGIDKCLRGLVNRDPWKISLNVRDVLHSAQLERLQAKAQSRKSGPNGELPSSAAQIDVDQEVLDCAHPGTSNMVHNEDTWTPSDSPHSCEMKNLAIKEELLTSDSDDSTYLDVNPSTIELDPDQVRAAEMMCANPVTIISGKGGCGKTTVVSLVFKAAMEQQTRDREEILKACEVFQNDSQGSSHGLLVDVHEGKTNNEQSDGDEKPVEVLLTAPTGRAASLLTKRTGFTAYTMHQVLWSFMNAKKDASGDPENWKFSEVRVLVVDEGSLVSVQILHSVLSMLLKHADLQKFIMLGDVRQLPSIQPGNALYDLFEGLKTVRWAIEMKTNHRAESELIVRNAGLISHMGKTKCYSPLEFDATINMTKPFKVPLNKRFIFIKTSGDRFDLQNAITFLLKEGPGLQSDRLSQFVAFRRNDCALINELCCKHYSDHVTRTPKNKFNFQPGDKVCCTKNGYISDHDERREGASCQTGGASHDNAGSKSQNEQEKENRERLCNGEIFFITSDETIEENGRSCKKKRYLTLDDDTGRVVTCCYRELQRECKLRHAWARTIHTFQGSEAETIVYILGDSIAQNWQHVYTAVTRGQKRVYVVGEESHLEEAIKRRITPRNTQLCGFVKAAVRQKDPGVSLTQSACSQTPVKHGFGPSQSTPVASQSPICPQTFSSARPPCVQQLLKDENGQSQHMSNISLQGDIAFSQTYSWSSMDDSEELSTVQDDHSSKSSNHNEDAALSGAVSSSLNESSRVCKRQTPVETCSTPTKLPKKTTSDESPVGSSRLNLLSITSPSSKFHGRQLFRDNAHT